MLIIANKKAPKNAEIFGCEKCDFKCCKKSDLDRRLTTAKHLNANNANNGDADIINKLKNCLYIKNEKNAILDLMAANRFWTFINVQKPKTAMALWKKREKSCCDCYALILIL